ncbi:SDR family oxidoreductase [Desulfobotulus mexicanus]|uniref:SDR family oxidoreductase n=1 Tax=Desulfobotulus mexicanus TaxID=2586642 RepID=A0A5Q4VIT5_9BACT|nr:SDR family oxidoreductase [Desulfobotulus mexicanus]TYT76127.1 SDR family oxidoreductase [Desulfobotulus mexicanus]
MKNILIIGAYSAIASATARMWAEKKARFFLVGRDGEKLKQTGEDLAARGATSFYTHTMDVNDTDAHTVMLAKAFFELGQVDLVLLAYGTLPDQLACEGDVKITMEALATNGVSTLALLTAISPMMEKQGSGCISVISSVAALRGRPSNYVYGSAKALVETFCEGLRARLFQSGVHLLLIRPGFVDTPMTKDLSLPGLLLVTPEQVAKDIIRAVDNKKDTLFTPWFWRWIMLVIRNIPSPLYKKFKL